MLFMTKECLYWAARNKMMNLKLFLKYTLAAEQSLMKISNYEAQGTSQDFEEGCKI